MRAFLALLLLVGASAARPEHIAVERSESFAEMAAKIAFKAADTDDDGMVSKSEFLAAVTGKEVSEGCTPACPAGMKCCPNGPGFACKPGGC